MLKPLRFRITGTAPLILHNGQTADPMNRFSKMLKQFTSKRDRTDADYEEMARIEWYASLYTNQGKICLPVDILEAMLIESSRKRKLKPKAQAGLFVKNDAILEFDGDNLSIDELWNRDQNRFTVNVKITGRSKVLRTRFKVNQWATEFESVYDDSLLNKQQVIDIISAGSSQVGIGDWHPKFGRFSFELTKAEEQLKAA